MCWMFHLRIGSISCCWCSNLVSWHFWWKVCQQRQLSYCWGQSGSADGNEHTGNSLMVPLDSIWFFLLLFQRNKTGRGTRQRGTRFRSFLASRRCNRSTELCLSHRYLQKIIKKTFRLYTAESRRCSLGLQVVAGGATVACQTLCVFVNSSKTPVWIMTPY